MRFTLSQQLQAGFTLLLCLLPPLPSVKLWHHCHQTWWAWGPSRQAFRPLSGLSSFCVQIWNFSVAHLPVLLSRPLSRAQRISSGAHLLHVVSQFCWLSDEQLSQESSWLHFPWLSLRLCTCGCFWNKLLISEKREITFLLSHQYLNQFFFTLFFTGLASLLCYPSFWVELLIQKSFSLCRC